MKTNQRFTTSSGKTFIIYHTNWSTYGRNFQVSDLPIAYIPDIAYAFFNLQQGTNGWEIVAGDAWSDTDMRYTDQTSVSPPDSWTDPPNAFYGNFGQFQKLLNQGKKFNLQLAVGGWTWSKHFSTAIAQESDRKSMSNSIVSLFRKYPIFNGISLDWEYLSDNGVNYGNAGNACCPNDAQNFVSFLTLLRKSLDASEMEYYHISFCVAADPEKANFPIEKIHPLIDEWHVMTYDFHDGSWGEKISAHQSNLYPSSHGKFSASEAVAFYLSRGVPSTKIFIGAAFYSRGFSNTEGLGKEASGGSLDKSWEVGVCDYKALPRDGAQEYWDDEAKAHYSYDATKRVFNSYDTVRSIQEKCKYVWEKDLGGIICWESSGDVPADHHRSLVRALYEGLVDRDPSRKPMTKKYEEMDHTVISCDSSPEYAADNVASDVAAISISAKNTPDIQLTKNKTNAWEVNKLYSVGDIIQSDDAYMCLQSHTSQIDWKPQVVPALWKKM